jgi:hypothetical protein
MLLNFLHSYISENLPTKYTLLRCQGRGFSTFLGNSQLIIQLPTYCDFKLPVGFCLADRNEPGSQNRLSFLNFCIDWDSIRTPRVTFPVCTTEPGRAVGNHPHIGSPIERQCNLLKQRIKTIGWCRWKNHLIWNVFQHLAYIFEQF